MSAIGTKRTLLVVAIRSAFDPSTMLCEIDGCHHAFEF